SVDAVVAGAPALRVSFASRRWTAQRDVSEHRSKGMDRLRSIARGKPDSDDISPGRLVAFSDGVFAIAITLLAFQLRVPDLPPGRGNALGAALRADAGQFVAFVLTFVVVGVYWRGHHRLFHFVRR